MTDERAIDERGSALYVGHVMHQRLRPKRHGLRYGIYTMLVDVDEVSRLHQRLRLFSVNRFNLFSLHEADYGDGRSEPLRRYVERQLDQAGVTARGRIQLLTMPRVLGYAFNPLNVYFCHDGDDVLQAILYEVNNTFGQRHSYLIPVGQRHGARHRVLQDCRKAFYVSPFMPLDLHYEFIVDPPEPGRIDLDLRINVNDGAGPVLVARLDAERRQLSDGALALAFVSHPLMTLKVIAGIHWEALKLLFKGVRLHTRPAPPEHPVTLVDRLDP